MKESIWKQQARKNLTFRNILESLLVDGEVQKELVNERLDIEGKYALICMDSDNLIKFESDKLVLKEDISLSELDLLTEIRQAV